MTAVNHAIAGSIVVASFNNPAIGLPLALASHFILDMLPHFSPDDFSKPGSREYRAIIMLDIFLTTLFILIITFVGLRTGRAWWILPAGGMLGWIPDIMWYKHYQKDLRGQPRDWTPLRRFHKRIQRYELPWGWWLEIVWYIVSIGVLSFIVFR